MTDDRLTYIRITAIRTADPNNWSVAKNSFMASDPFGIAMDVAATSSLTQIGLLYDAVLQVGNPRECFASPHTWFRTRPWRGWTTVDRVYKDIPLQWATFLVGTSWVRFENVTERYEGLSSNKNSGIFYARGSVNIQGTNLFDVSEAIPFKVEI
jgi:hypothetical protein